MTSFPLDQLGKLTAHGTPVRVIDPQTQAAFVLLSNEQFEKIRALFDDDEFDIAEAYPLMDEVARSEGWDDPEMDIYNQFREPQK